MKKLVLIIVLFCTAISFAQQEEQPFCEGDPEGSYFPLDIEEKIIYWYYDYYTEKRIGEVEINGKDYTQFTQTWNFGQLDSLYWRQKGKKILEYHETIDLEILRF